jgi:hypothetical protein
MLEQFQFCMGDIDFNIPITINMNLGRDKKKRSVQSGAA